MPTTYLALLNGVATTDTYAATEHNKLVETIDRNALMNWSLFGSGRHSGWYIISGASTVSSGTGQVGPAWCKNAAAQAISGLTGSGIKYIHAITTAGSASSGVAKFVARDTSTAVTNYDTITTGVCIGSATYVAATGLKAISTGPMTKHIVDLLRAHI